MRRNKIATILLILGLVGAAAYVLYRTNDDFRVMEQKHWTDRQLIDHFRKNQQAFEHLCSKAISKTPFTVTASSVFLGKKTNVSEAEVEEFRNTLRKLNIGGIALAEGANRVAMVSTTRGWFSHESEKGYVCTKGDERPGVLVGSLDGISHTESTTLYVHIEGNWYLYYSGY
jgi:hypothetical protein